MPTRISDLPNDGTVSSGAEVVYSQGATFRATVKDLLQVLSEADLNLSDISAILKNLGAVSKSGDSIGGDLDVEGTIRTIIGRVETNGQFVFTRGDGGTAFIDLRGTGSLAIRNNTAGVVTDIGRILPRGEEMPQPFDMVTREKGDARYFLGEKSVNEVGCVVHARSGAPNTKEYGSTISGSALRLTDNTGHSVGPPLAGAWECKGHCLSGNASIFVKVG